MPDRPADRPATDPSDRAADRPGPRPSPDEVRAYYAARPSPLVAATGIVLDRDGRVLVLTPSYKADLELPGGTVEDTETPEEALARELAEELDLSVPVGRLLAVDSRRPGSLGRALIAHVHLVGPLSPEQAGALSFPDGEVATARWLAPEEAYAVLPARIAPRLRAGLAALYSGSLAHLVDGVPQPGSPAGLDPQRRTALEHAGSFDAASHRAARPKAITAASVLYTDAAGRILLVEPTYGKPGRWNLPGGGIDSDLGETPRAAARREVREELGLDLEPGRLLGVNWSHKPDYPARIRFLYDGGVLDPAALARIRLAPFELLRWRAVPAGELRALVKPSLRRQIEACLRARTEGTGALELHAGRPAGTARKRKKSQGGDDKGDDKGKR
ncbi:MULTISPECIES: NUDIX hydrolase [unclassified Streptomyces]|uniref:NUDIX hydrolase n=1 Tax=unclassified Streptomyces TaxID=2593676 RepID=UPI002E165E14|nr:MULTISPECIES: NUDIX hydrolase [unclassified Streptomyces]WSR22223.1 NUDIX hydrolase [Streptomyces sp. NBC_01205]